MCEPRWFRNRQQLAHPPRRSRQGSLRTVVAALGLVGVVGDDTTGGVDGPNLAAILGFYVLLTLLAVLGLDWMFRAVHSGARRL